MPAIGKEPRRVVIDLIQRFIAFADLNGFAARCGYSPKTMPVTGEDNHSITIPGTAADTINVERSQGLWRAARNIELLELAVGLECDESPVGRPERLAGEVHVSLRAGHDLRLR